MGISRYSGCTGQDTRLVGLDKALRAGELFAERRVVAVSDDRLKRLDIFLQHADVGPEPRYFTARIDQAAAL